MTLEQQLKDLTHELARAQAAYSEASEQRKALEKAQMDTLRAQHVDLYAREETSKSQRDELETRARTLLDTLRTDTGQTGSVIDGLFQITTSHKLELADGMSMADLVHYITTQMPFLSAVLTVDMAALDKQLGGKIPDLVAKLPVRYMPHYSSRIMWSKLPAVTPKVDAQPVQPEPAE